MMSKENKDLYELIEQSLEDSKAQEISALELVGKSSLCDYMFFATGTSSRHISAIVSNLQKSLKEAGIKGLTPEGAGTSSWIVLDAGDIIVHVFQPEARDKYRLEELWSSR